MHGFACQDGGSCRIGEQRHSELRLVVSVGAMHKGVRRSASVKEVTLLNSEDGNVYLELE